MGVANSLRSCASFAFRRSSLLRFAERSFQAQAQESWLGWERPNSFEAWDLVAEQKDGGVHEMGENCRCGGLRGAIERGDRHVGVVEGSGEHATT